MVSLKCRPNYYLQCTLTIDNNIAEILTGSYKRLVLICDLERGSRETGKYHLCMGVSQTGDVIEMEIS